jgi:hypothetical protein
VPCCVRCVLLVLHKLPSPAAHSNLSKTRSGTPQNFASRKGGMKLYMTINMYLHRNADIWKQSICWINLSTMKQWVCVLRILIRKDTAFFWLWANTEFLVKFRLSPGNLWRRTGSEYCFTRTTRPGVATNLVIRAEGQLSSQAAATPQALLETCAGITYHGYCRRHKTNLHYRPVLGKS